MEDFNQVMMDGLLELGFELAEPPPDEAWNGSDNQARRNMLFRWLEGKRAAMTWRYALFEHPLQAEHDYDLDQQDLGLSCPDHSAWTPSEFEPMFTRITVPMAYYSHIRRVTLVSSLLESETQVS
jgi:hypothetical protein